LFSTSQTYLPTIPPGVSSVLLTAGLSSFQIEQVVLPQTFSLFDGPDVVHKHFKLNTTASKLLNDRALKTKADDFAKVQGAVNKMADRAVYEQEFRMEYEEKNGAMTTRVNVTDATILKETKAKLHRELTALATKQVGFILFLNLNQPNLPAIESMIPQPFHPKNIIEKLLNKAQLGRGAGNGKENNGDEAVEHEEDEEEEETTKTISNAPENRNKQQPTNIKENKNILYTGALEIVKTAKDVLSEIENGKLAVRDVVGPIELLWFASTHITTSEKNYYEARNNVLKVLNIVASHYDAAPKWEPFPLQTLSLADRTRIEETRLKHQEQIQHASTISASFLVPLGHGLGSNVEIVERGVGPSIMKGGRSKNPEISKKGRPVLNQSQRKRKLNEAVTGLNCGCSIVYCTNMLTTTMKCAVCVEAFCSDHTDHEVHVNLQTEYLAKASKNNKEGEMNVEADDGNSSCGTTDNNNNNNNNRTASKNNNNKYNTSKKTKQNKESQSEATKRRNNNKRKEILQKLNNMVSVQEVQEVQAIDEMNTINNKVLNAAERLDLDFNIYLNRTANADVSQHLEKLVDRLLNALHGELSKKCRDFPLRIKNELDFTMYRCHYVELLNYFNITMPFDILASHEIPSVERFKIEHVRNRFLTFFGKVLCEKLNLKNSGVDTYIRKR